MSITISEITGADTFLSGNEIYVKATSGGVPEGVTGHKILLKIVSVDNILVGSPFVDAVEPDANGVAEFDISGYLDQAIDKVFHWPIPTPYEGRWHGYENQVYDVQLVPGERYINLGGELTESYGSAFGTIFVVKGKLPHYFAAYLNQYSLTWFSYFCTDGRWFTFMPLTQKVHPNQPVKLWWKPPATGLTFTLKAKAYYGDGTVKNYAASPTMWYDVMFEFEVGADGLGFPPVDAGVRLLYYEVWMEGTPNLDKRTFVLDWTPNECTNYLFVDNQVGGVDCIWLSGAVKYAPEGERSVAVKPFARGMNTRKRTRFIGSSKRTRKWVINSGHKSRPEMEALDILLDSPNVWLVKQPANGSDSLAQYSIVPVTILSTALQLTDSMNDLESVDIELEEAF